MAQIIREIRVDVSQPNVFQAIVAKQLDCNSRFLKITLVDFGVKIEVPKTAKVTINANRPDGKSQSFMGVANNDGTITVPLAQWMLEVAGELKCDVSVINTTNNKRLTSTDFYVNVQEAANKSTDISENPDGEIRVITPTQKIDKNSSDDEYPSAKAVYDLDNITATASGSAITIDSANAPLQNLKLYGKTEQDGTLGENVLPYPYTATTQTQNGVTFTDLGDGRIQVKGTATDSVAYYIFNGTTISGLVVGRRYRLTGDNYATTNVYCSMQYAKSDSTVGYLNFEDGYEFTAESTALSSVIVKLEIPDGTTVDTIVHPKLEVASVDLVSLGDSGSFEVGVYGRNLLAVNNTTQTINGVTFTNNGDGSVSVKGTATKETTYSLCANARIKLPKGKYKTISANCAYYLYLDNILKEVYTKAQNNIEIGDGNYTLYPHIWIGANSTVEFTVTPMLLLEDETDTTFVKGETPQTLTLTDTLRSAGVQDEIDFARGMKTQRILNLTADDIISVNRGIYSKAYRYVLGFDYFKAKENVAISNLFTFNASVLGLNNIDKVISAYSPGDSRLYVRYDAITTEAEFLQFLKDNNFECNVILATPIETPLTETELNAYRHLMTNKGNTTILSECEDTEITYYVNKPNAQAIGSLHEQINKDYLKLQQAIISTGGSTL